MCIVNFYAVGGVNGINNKKLLVDQSKQVVQNELHSMGIPDEIISKLIDEIITGKPANVSSEIYENHKLKDILKIEMPLVLAETGLNFRIHMFPMLLFFHSLAALSDGFF